MRIHPRLLRSLAVRGGLAWLTARFLAAILLGLAASAPAAIASSDQSGLDVTVWVFGLASALVYVDLLRRRELMLWRNLGLAPAAVVGVAMVPGAVVELAWLLT